MRLSFFLTATSAPLAVSVAGAAAQPATATGHTCSRHDGGEATADWYARVLRGVIPDPQKIALRSSWSFETLDPGVPIGTWRASFSACSHLVERAVSKLNDENGPGFASIRDPFVTLAARPKVLDFPMGGMLAR